MFSGKRKRKISENDTTKLRNSYCNVKEDLENKQGRKKNCLNRGSNKKKVLEEANNSKLRDVQVRVEDCLQNASHTTALSAICRRTFEESAKETLIEEQEEDKEKEEEDEEPVVVNSSVEEEVREVDEERVKCDNDCALDDASNGSSVQLVPVELNSAENVCDIEPVPETVVSVSEVVSEEDDCVIVAQRTVEKNDERECSSRGDDDGPLSSSSPFSRMELAESANASLLRFPDDRSDSGVSSLRSGSGDERSGSRSSALSSSDEPQHITQNQSTNRSPLFIPTNQSFSTPTSSSSSEPVRVWRDPSLLLESEPHVRHIHSVQHQSLLMSHPSTPAASGPPPTSAAANHPANLYPPVPPPPNLMSPHHLHNHPHLPPPPHIGYPHHMPEMLWKRYPLQAAHLLGPQTAGHPATEEILNAYADRDRHERLMR